MSNPANIPPITVAIPTMNGARHLAETVRSVLGQEGVAFDLLVSDDRSTDETLTIVRDLAGDRARIVENAERLGLAGNWNQCVRLSRTPLVAIVHQDDVLRPNHLAVHVAAFAIDENIGLVASDADVIDDQGKQLPETVVDRGGLGAQDETFSPWKSLPLMAIGNPLRCSAVSLRVEALQDVGGFDPALQYVVDWECWLRLARRWSLAWRAETTVDMRWHPASETHRFTSGIVDLEETELVLAGLLNELREQPGVDLSIEPKARRKLARAYLNRAYEVLKKGNGPLARECLGRALRMSPQMLGTLAVDPRLASQMLAATVAPTLAGRWFGRSDS
jgi:Glycosyl transferase family 2